MLVPFVLALMAASPAHMLGSIDNNGVVRPLKVKTYEGAQVCTLRVTEAGDHATLVATGCPFAKAVRVEGSYAEQRYLDASGAQVARGKQAEDGYWVYTPDGKRYQLTY